MGERPNFGGNNRICDECGLDRRRGDGWLAKMLCRGVFGDICVQFARKCPDSRRKSACRGWKRVWKWFTCPDSDNNPCKRCPKWTVRIFYRDIGEYLSREEKLAKISRAKVFGGEFEEIYPNERCDWINQRGNEFETFIPLHDLQNPIY